MPSKNDVTEMVSAESSGEVNESKLLLEKNESKTTTLGWEYYVGVLFALVNTVADVCSVTCIQIIGDIPPEFQLNTLRSVSQSVHCMHKSIEDDINRHDIYIILMYFLNLALRIKKTPQKLFRY